MSYALKQLHDFDPKKGGVETSGGSKAVDIVAIHDLNHSIEDGWKDEKSGILWLRDLLPQSLRMTRVLAFEYDSSATRFFSGGCERSIRNHAVNLVTSLQTDRDLEGCQQRPIIFICHGLGGLIVKQALIHSSSQTSAKVEIYYSIFVCTYAIMFLGTPHNQYELSNWLDYERHQQSHRLRDKIKHMRTPKADFEIINSINARFSSFLKHFHVYFFWEDMMTEFGDRLDYMVEDHSAAPIIDDTERAGIYASHYDMVKHTRADSSSYRTILAALLRYARAASTLVFRRWEKANAHLRRIRSEKAYELTGFEFDIHIEDTHRRASEAGELNEYFFLPREALTDFVGREEVVQTMETGMFFSTLAENHARQRIFVIHGMGGSGKTRVCCKFARSHRQRYWGIFTIDATSMETAKASFAELGRLGGLEATESAGRHWISTRKQPWLLIIDNADDPSLDVPRLFPDGLAGHILITTRNPDLRRLATAGSIELKGMKKNEALQLLFKRAEIPTPWEKAIEDAGHDIAEALGYLALALTQAGNCISRKFCDLHNYLSYYEIYRTQHSSRIAEQNETTDDEINVYPTFDFSLSSLQVRNTMPCKDALELLNIVAFYHFDNIRVDIFTRATENSLKSANQPADISMTARIAGRLGHILQPPQLLPNFLKDDPTRLDQFRIRRALYELYKLSFITYTVKGEAFSLHPLIHSWARDRLDNPEKKIWAQVALNTLLASISLPPDDVDDSQGSFKRDLLPHLDACLRTCSVKIGYSDIPPSSFQLTMCKFFGWSLFFIIRQQILAAAKCGFLFASRGRFSDAAKYLTITMESLIQLLGEKNEKTMASMLGLAGVFWGLGRLDEAISLQKRVVQARSNVHGAQHPDTLRAMDQLGRSYWLHGYYLEALSIQKTTTEYMEKALGAEHDDTLAALDNFGVTLGSWHRYEESKAIHTRVLAVRKARLGLDHLDTLATMNNLAMAHLDLQNFKEAKTLMRQVYDGRRKQLGKEHPWTLWALSNFAKTKIELTELEEAEEMLVEGIAAAKRSLGEDHLGVLMGCGELTKAYTRQGRLEEAELLGVETVRKLELSRGIVHPDVVWARWKVAQLFERAGKYEEAHSMCEIAIERAKMRLGVEHPMFRLLTEKTAMLKKRISGAIEETEDGKSIVRRTQDEVNMENGEKDEELLSKFLLHRMRGKKTW